MLGFGRRHFHYAESIGGKRGLLLSAALVATVDDDVGGKLPLVTGKLR